MFEYVRLYLVLCFIVSVLLLLLLLLGLIVDADGLTHLASREPDCCAFLFCFVYSFVRVESPLTARERVPPTAGARVADHAQRPNHKRIRSGRAALSASLLVLLHRLQTELTAAEKKRRTGGQSGGEAEAGPRPSVPAPIREFNGRTLL